MMDFVKILHSDIQFFQYTKKYNLFFSLKTHHSRKSFVEIKHIELKFYKKY